MRPNQCAYALDPRDDLDVGGNSKPAQSAPTAMWLSTVVILIGAELDAKMEQPPGPSDR